MIMILNNNIQNVAKYIRRMKAVENNLTRNLTNKIRIRADKIHYERKWELLPRHCLLLDPECDFDVTISNIRVITDLIVGKG